MEESYTTYTFGILVLSIEHVHQSSHELREIDAHANDLFSCEYGLIQA